MKNYKLALATTIVAIGLTGCNSTTEFTKRDMNEVPDFMVELPQSEEKIYARGTGLSSDLQVALDEAKLHARDDLAGKINSEVSSVLTKSITDNNNEITEDSFQQGIKVTVKKVELVDFNEEKTRYFVEDESSGKIRAFTLISLSREEFNRLVKLQSRAQQVTGKNSALKEVLEISKGE